MKNNIEESVFTEGLVQRYQEPDIHESINLRQLIQIAIKHGKNCNTDSLLSEVGNLSHVYRDGELTPLLYKDDVLQIIKNCKQ